MIADGERAQGVAGVIGGQDSEVTAETTDIVLELAAFDAKRVRAARRALGVSTDAAFRFERVVSPSLPVEVFATAVKLMVALTGAHVVEPVALIGAAAQPPRPIAVRAARVAQVLGVAVPSTESATLLESVGFAVCRTRGPPRGHRPELAGRRASRDRSRRGGRSAPRIRFVS